MDDDRANLRMHVVRWMMTEPTSACLLPTLLPRSYLQLTDSLAHVNAMRCRRRRRRTPPEAIGSDPAATARLLLLLLTRDVLWQLGLAHQRGVVKQSQGLP